jgi:hypothetical protein
MDLGSIMNIGALAAQPRSSDSEFSVVSRIENSARTRAYSPGRRQAAGRQDSDLADVVVDDADSEPYGPEKPAPPAGKINFFA